MDAHEEQDILHSRSSYSHADEIEIQDISYGRL
jgi:hypothetical protein